jgi:hypothetical protein
MLIFPMFVAIYLMSPLVRVLRFVLRRWRVLRRQRDGAFRGKEFNGVIGEFSKDDSAKVSTRKLPGGAHDAALQTPTRR